MSVLRSMIEAAARAKKVVIDTFIYSANWAPLAANATTPVTIPISADSDFLWMETCIAVFTAVGVFNPNPDLLLSFADTGSGRFLQDQPVHVFQITGNGQWPYILPEPKLLIGNGGVTLTLTERQGVQQGLVQVSLIGVKVFYIDSYNRANLIQGIS